MKFLILFLLTFSLQIDGIENKLKYVFNIVRHGARSPWNQVRNFRDSIGFKWAGDSELTDRGLRQLFLLGMKMRLRYVNDLQFLSSSFNPDEMEIKSTDTNRTISSAYSYMTGMYPPYTGPTLSPAQSSHAIPPIASPDQPKIINELQYAALPHFSEVYPIHIFAKIDNYFNLQDPIYCKGVSIIKENNKDRPFVKKFQRDFLLKYSKLKNALNYTDDYLYNYDNLKLFCDAVISSYFDKRDLNRLQVNSTEIYDSCKEIMKIDLFQVSLLSEKDQIINVAMTPPMMKFISYFDTYISLENKGIINSLNLPKFTLYAAHDLNIATFLSYFIETLQIKIKPSYIPFAANILIEFHKLDNAPIVADSSYYVIHIYYNEELIYNDTYERFKKAVKKTFISNSEIDSFCGFEDNSGLYYMIAICCLACTAFGLGLWILLLLFKNKPVEQPLLPQ